MHFKSRDKKYHVVYRIVARRFTWNDNTKYLYLHVSVPTSGIFTSQQRDRAFLCSPEDWLIGWSIDWMVFFFHSAIVFVCFRIIGAETRRSIYLSIHWEIDEQQQEQRLVLAMYDRRCKTTKRISWRCRSTDRRRNRRSGSTPSKIRYSIEVQQRLKW